MEKRAKDRPPGECQWSSVRRDAEKHVKETEHQNWREGGIVVAERREEKRDGQ